LQIRRLPCYPAHSQGILFSVSRPGIEPGHRRAAVVGGPSEGPMRSATPSGCTTRADDSLCTFVNETTGLWLVRGLFPQVLPFEGDAVLRLVQKGLYRKRR